MAVIPTYPGVYVEELSSGVRSVAALPTSITAFVGRALRGPTDLYDVPDQVPPESWDVVETTTRATLWPFA